MMEDHEFCDTCPGCRPAMLDLKTGQVMTADHPVMVVVNHVWDHDTTYEERKGFIEVSLHNSRREDDLRLAASINDKIMVAVQNLNDAEFFDKHAEFDLGEQ